MSSPRGVRATSYALKYALELQILFVRCCCCARGAFFGCIFPHQIALLLTRHPAEAPGKLPKAQPAAGKGGWGGSYLATWLTAELLILFLLQMIGCKRPRKKEEVLSVRVVLKGYIATFVAPVDT
jgi:hypothetical protein